ncbi:MAG: amidohydrolase family protein [Bacteroides sp.]|nr:amidohydrolase family protein [Bacteroides sp.]MCM1379953.1 amidohydrolase family protein [Bacteroides sp.]MCM1446292.1 amidohydrolase family protein [Prevotella sp.]
MKTTVIHNAEIVSGEGRPIKSGWLLIQDERIAAMGKGERPKADIEIDAEGDLLMPGMIDTHVHFRDPGLTHKADIESESAAAVAGGVTSFVDMPNTIPPTTSIEAWEAKMARAAEVSKANYAFYIGASNSNLQELLKADYSKVAGVKLFLGSSTGNLLVDNHESLVRLFASVKAPIAVHAEDNARIALNAAIAREAFGDESIPIEFHPLIRDARACLDSTLTAIELAQQGGAHLHLLHISTAAEARLLREYKPEWLTAETCVQYLTFCDADYESLGARIKCNPAIKSSSDRTALRKALKDGVIDIVASDHAPHLLSEKIGDALSAPSGLPNMQFQFVQLLDIYKPAEVAQFTAANPAKIFKIDGRGVLKPGNYADIVRIARKEQTVTDDISLSKCGWTPAAGQKVGHTVVATWVNGSLNHKGQSLTFKR